jgi:hypothetical protein
VGPRQGKKHAEYGFFHTFHNRKYILVGPHKVDHDKPQHHIGKQRRDLKADGDPADQKNEPSYNPEDCFLAAYNADESSEAHPYRCTDRHGSSAT